MLYVDSEISTFIVFIGGGVYRSMNMLCDPLTELSNSPSSLYIQMISRF